MALENSKGNGNQNGANPVLEFPEELKVKAREFFKKGAEVAYALNYDYAIELYLDGLSIWPDALDEGHKPLREVALRRKEAGQKKAGMFGDSSKFRKSAGKTPKEAMLKAEYLLSKDPTNLALMTDLVKAASEGDYRQTTLWFANLLFEFNRQKDKPSLQTYILLREVYVKIEAFARALQACQQALQLKPHDTDLENALRDLSAQTTMQQGKYDGQGDFRDSIKDRINQEKLQAQSQSLRSTDVKADALEKARREYQENPTIPGKINNLVNALCDTEEEDRENEAIEILEKSYIQSKQFRYKQHSGQIRIKQWNRRVRKLQLQLKNEPDNQDTKKQLVEATKESLRIELEHYKLSVENYPTDMGIKYEYGKRLMRAQQYDQAIPVFQEARNDPRFRVASINFIGQCFYFKEWYTDAIESFELALEAVEDQEGAIAKELRYNLGRAYEAEGNIEQALNCYRKVAQIDYNYQDVKDRVDSLRKQQQEKK
ncbi:MAG: Tetratricopeptide repeat protein [Planctomycetes bacterium ADurb.Bin412]|nr:MAG: Tetratricopeptide repeat protein [Planctomycetes bacterium ADurb.Bin412]